MRQDLRGPADTPFAETLSRFSRQLAARAATVDTQPGDVALARREALRAYDRARRQRVVVMAGLAVAALAGAGMPLGLALVTPPTEPPLRAPPPTPAPAVAATVAPAAPAAPAAAALDRAEIRDVQARLRGFGFDPGPLDGDPGPRTLAAAQRYQESRNQPRSDEVDRALLEQLRLDPAPVVVPSLPVAQRGGRGASSAARGQSSPANPFDRLGRWLDSLVR